VPASNSCLEHAGSPGLLAGGVHHSARGRQAVQSTLPVSSRSSVDGRTARQRMSRTSRQRSVGLVLKGEEGLAEAKAARRCSCWIMCNITNVYPIELEYIGGMGQECEIGSAVGQKE
jgi:hypothetical protein